MKIFVIGPGGVGKSTVGKLVADSLNLNFIDLDDLFLKKIGEIGKYIKINGYEEYSKANSELFYRTINNLTDNYLFALSSGFLVYKDSRLNARHYSTISDNGISILILPSRSLEESRSIVVKRQLKRGFGLQREREEEKFTKRFREYQEFGDIKIFSHTDPKKIASIITNKLKSIIEI